MSFLIKINKIILKLTKRLTSNVSTSFSYCKPTILLAQTMSSSNLNKVSSNSH